MIDPELAQLENDATYATQAAARVHEAVEILRPLMENNQERTVAEACALLSPEDAARVDALLPAYIRVRKNRKRPEPRGDQP